MNEKTTSNSTTVIIVTHRRRELLAQCLASLEGQSRRPEEVVVVVNGDDPETARFLEDYPGDLVIKPVQGPGEAFAEARNLGVSEAAGGLIAFLDDDCEADRFWLDRMAGALEENGWTAAGGAVLPADLLEAPAAWSPELCWLTGMSPPGLFGPLGGRRYLPSTSSLIARREAFVRIPFQALRGRLSGEVGDYLAGREDAQWWETIRRTGEPTGIAARAIVWHHVGRDRMDWDYIEERARADGAAAWRRELNPDRLRQAARDVVFTPYHAVKEALWSDQPGLESWWNHATWAKRQAAFLAASVNDQTGNFSPQARTGLLAKESLRLASSLGKACTRLALKSGWSALHASRRLPTVDDPPERLVVVLYPFLGDAVLALPMLNQLQRALPQTEITVLASDYTRELIDSSTPGETIVEALPGDAAGWSPGAVSAMKKHLRRLSPDAVLIAYLHGLSPAPLLLPGRIPVVSWRRDNGFNQQLWGDLVDHPVEKNFDQHEVAALLNLLTPFGISTRLERPKAKASSRAKEKISRILGRIGIENGAFAVIHLDVVRQDKAWRLDGFRSAARWLEEEAGVKILWLGGRRGKKLAEELEDSLPHAVSLHGRLDAAETAALLSRARIFLGPDSGPAHLAQAVGTPSVLLFGGTDPARWGPLPPLKGETLPPFAVLDKTSGDWLAEEQIGLPPNHGVAMIQEGDVREALEKLLSFGGSKVSEAPENEAGE